MASVSDIHNDSLTFQHSREQFLKKAYGEKSFENVLEIDNALAKINWEMYNFKAKKSKPIYEKRAELIKAIPGFWLQAMTNDKNVNNFIDAIDRDPLKHLNNISVLYDENDCRNYDFIFEFSDKNPYFSNRILKKSYKLAAPLVNGDSAVQAPSLASYDLDADLVTSRVSIDWSSDEHNLVKKKPRASEDDLVSMEPQEDDVTEFFGSFFNWFIEDEDQYNIGDTLLNFHSKAHEFYAGIIDLDQAEDDEDEEDEDEEDDDPNQIVNLDEESDDEKPKKKKSRTVA